MYLNDDTNGNHLPRLHVIHNQNFPRRTSSHLNTYSPHYTLNHTRHNNNTNTNNQSITTNKITLRIVIKEPKDETLFQA